MSNKEKVLVIGGDEFAEALTRLLSMCADGVPQLGENSGGRVLVLLPECYAKEGGEIVFKETVPNA